jgi:hypothetical protein
VTSVTIGADGAGTLPDYAPTPQSALGPALNDQGCYVGERNLHWDTDGASVGVPDHRRRRRAVRIQQKGDPVWAPPSRPY